MLAVLTAVASFTARGATRNLARPSQRAIRMLGSGATTKADEEVLYALGLNVARNLGELKTVLMPEELKIVGKAIQDKLLDEDNKDIDPAALTPEMQKLLGERQLLAQGAAVEAGKTFLAEAAAREGAVQTDSGLVYEEVREGSGAQPTADQKVTAHYTGTLADGTVFDSSVARGEPLTFSLGGVIKGWQEGLQMMKVGGKAVLTIPSDLAYGPNGTGPIPGGAVLKFDVELLSVE